MSCRLIREKNDGGSALQEVGSLNRSTFPKRGVLHRRGKSPHHPGRVCRFNFPHSKRVIARVDPGLCSTLGGSSRMGRLGFHHNLGGQRCYPLSFCPEGLRLGSSTRCKLHGRRTRHCNKAAGSLGVCSGPLKKAVRLQLENEKMAGGELKALMGASTCL